MMNSACSIVGRRKPMSSRIFSSFNTNVACVSWVRHMRGSGMIKDWPMTYAMSSLTEASCIKIWAFKGLPCLTLASNNRKRSRRTANWRTMSSKRTVPYHRYGYASNTSSAVSNDTASQKISSGCGARISTIWSWKPVAAYTIFAWSIGHGNAFLNKSV